MKETIIKRVSPRQLIHKPRHSKSRSFFTQGKTKLIDRRSTIPLKQRGELRRSPQLSEEIVYEYDEDDMESEHKIKSLIDFNDTTEVTSSSEIPSVSNKVQEAMPKAPYLYQMRSRHMHYLRKDSFSTNKAEEISESESKGKCIKIKKGNILKQGKGKTYKIGMMNPTEPIHVSAVMTKPDCKEVLDSSISLEYSESYEIYPKTTDSTVPVKAQHKRKDAIDVSIRNEFPDTVSQI